MTVVVAMVALGTFVRPIHVLGSVMTPYVLSLSKKKQKQLTILRCPGSRHCENRYLREILQWIDLLKPLYDGF